MDFTIKYKNESLFMKVLGLILFFNPEFMNLYSTTIGTTIYFPSKEYVKNNPYLCTAIIAHEKTHMMDESVNFFYKLLYLLPQVLASLSLFSFISWYFLFFLLFLLPIPSPGRKYYEYRGYVIQLYVFNELFKANKLSRSYVDKEVGFIKKQFSGPAYYFMWPFNLDSLSDVYKQIQNGEKPILDIKYFDMADEEIKNILK
jgi:hypothetical protein